VPADASAQITDLSAGDHACLTYGEADELADLTAAFVRDGLAGGLQVIWLGDADTTQSAAGLERHGVAAAPAIASGQLTAAACDRYLLRGQGFDAGHAAGWLCGQITAAQQAGFPGLRVAVDMGWALRPVRGIEQLPAFEEKVSAVLAGTRAAVLCQYDRERFDPVTLATITASHTRPVAAATYHADAVLRICRQYAPPGIRLAGEIDYHAREPLSLALAEAIRLDGDVTINMARLAFIDAPCTRMILDAARTIAASRNVVLRCSPQITSQLEISGAGDVPGVSVATTDGQ
jgi:anti-anti-sigma regulatory factor